MAVGPGVPFNQHTGNGVTKTFAYGFTLLRSGDLLVTVNNVATTDYVVSGVGAPNGGTITFGTAPASGARVELRLVIGLSRTTQYQTNGDLLAETVNADFDRLWQALGIIDFERRRVLRVPGSETVNELASAAVRAGKFLAFDDDGQPVPVSADSGSAQELALALANDAGHLIRVQAGPDGFARWIADIFRDCVNVKNYGAIGDFTLHPLSERFGADLAKAQEVYPHVSSLTQSIDWAAEVAALTDAVAAGLSVKHPAGGYVLNDSLDFTLVDDFAIDLFGDGDHNSLLLDATLGDDFITIHDTGPWWLNNTADGATGFSMRHIGIATLGENVGRGTVLLGANIVGRPQPRVLFDCVTWRSFDNFTQAWDVSLFIQNRGQATFKSCRWITGGPTNNAHTSIAVGSTDETHGTGDYFFDHCTWFYGNYGLYVGNFVEGVKLTQPLMVGQTTGFAMRPEEGESGFWILGGHFNCRLHNINVRNMFDWSIVGTLLYSNEGNPEWKGIRVEGGGRASIIGVVAMGLLVLDVGTEEAAIYIVATEPTVGFRGFNITGCVLLNCGLADIWLGGASEYVTVSNTNTHEGSTNRVLNQGLSGTNRIIPRQWTFGPAVVPLTSVGQAEHVHALPLQPGFFSKRPLQLSIKCLNALGKTYNAEYDVLHANSTASSARVVFERKNGANFGASESATITVVATEDTTGIF